MQRPLLRLRVLKPPRMMHASKRLFHVKKLKENNGKMNSLTLDKRTSGLRLMHCASPFAWKFICVRLFREKKERHDQRVQQQQGGGAPYLWGEQQQQRGQPQQQQRAQPQQQQRGQAAPAYNSYVRPPYGYATRAPHSQ